MSHAKHWQIREIREIRVLLKNNIRVLKNIREIRVQKNLVFLRIIRLIREIRVQKNLVFLRIIRLIREIRVQKNLVKDSRERFVVSPGIS